ncbi:LysR family transcriptional regulator [Idiomarina abyssalis]|uniref:LysR family transcriptional regulator n=1 Tax=Idiomarina abyssalis TaxID=86102 RepID=UPI003A956832
MKNTKLPSLNALRVFDVAARSGSFKQASQELGVTQSAVTRQIQTLEEQLEVRLFQRDNRVHSLTPVGLELAPQIEQIFEQLERTIERTRNLSDNTTTQLTVAISSERLRFWLAGKLADFHSLYPHIQLSFSRCNEHFVNESAAEMASAIQHQSRDLAIGYGKTTDKNIQSVTLQKNQLVPVSAIQTNESPFHLPWLINPDNPDHQAMLKAYSQELASTRMIHCNDVQMSLDLSAAEQAIALIDSSLITPGLSNLKVYNDFARPCQYPLSVYYRKRQRQPVALVAFIKWLQLIIS